MQGFEPAAPAGEQSQTYALDHAATGIRYLISLINFIKQVGYNIVRCLLIFPMLLMFFVHSVVNENL